MGKNKSIIIIFTGIILLAVGILFLLSSNKKNDVNNDVDNVENEKIKEIDIDKKSINLVTNLVSISNVDLSNSFFVYQNKKVSVNNIDSKVYCGSALSLIETSDVRPCTEAELSNNPNCDFTINSEILLSKLKELYGDMKTILPDKIDGNMYLSCILNGNVYECMNHSENNEEIFNDYINYFGSTNYTNVTKIVKVEESSKYLYIYEKYIGLRVNKDELNPNNLDTYVFSLYKYSNTDDKLIDDKIIGKEYYQDKSKTFKDKVLEKYENIATTFKHTFEKSVDGNYIYVSTEEVK